MGRSKLERKQGQAGLLAAGAGLVCSIAAGSLVRWGEAALTPASLFIALLMIVTLACVAVLPWWRTLDYMQREAQYFSWHWGATAGAAAAFCAIIAFQGMSSELIRGALLLAIAQVVGYGLFWLLWAVRHKSEDA